MGRKKEEEAWTPWEIETEEAETKLEVRRNRRTGLIQTKVQAVIPASSGDVWGALVTPETYMEVMPKTVESRYLEENPKKRELTCYQRVRGGAVSDRDYTLQVRWTEEKTRHGLKYHRSWTVANEKGPPPRAGSVRVEVNDGAWTLTPIAAKKTAFEQVCYIELGGSLWTMLANGAVRDAAKELARNLRKRFS